MDQNSLEYQFTDGNVKSAFTILSGTGQIRLVRKLDFDNNDEPKVSLNLTETFFNKGEIGET